MTRYAYDEKSFRLRRLRSEMFQRSVSGDTRTYSPQGGKLQDLHYAYDAVGNIHSIESRGTGLGIEPGDFAYLAEATWGSFSADSLLRRFEYDPLYRLTRATGRERKGVEPIFWGNQVPGGSSVEEARPYIEPNAVSYRCCRVCCIERTACCVAACRPPRHPDAMSFESRAGDVG